MEKLGAGKLPMPWEPGMSSDGEAGSVAGTGHHARW